MTNCKRRYSESPDMISRRTIIWFALLLLLGGGTALRFHWEKVRCVDDIEAHAYKGTNDGSPASNSVAVSADQLCQPGELEPWWARLLILGAFIAFIAL